MPRGENLEYFQSLPEQVPDCYKRHLEKKEKSEQDPKILYFDVNIGKGKTGKLGLKPSDDPVEKAREFARIFSLGVEMEEALAEMLIGYQSEMGVCYGGQGEGGEPEEEMVEEDGFDVILEDEGEMEEVAPTPRYSQNVTSFLKNYSSNVSNYMN